jgi:hypothetical protein
MALLQKEHRMPSDETKEKSQQEKWVEEPKSIRGGYQKPPDEPQPPPPPPPPPPEKK